MESSWIPPTSSANRRSRPAVSALAWGRARCCRSRNSVVTARNVTGRRGIARGWLNLRDDFLGKGAQRVPVVGAVAERDVDAGAAGIAELRDQLARIFRRAAQPAPQLVAPLAPVTPEALFSAGRALGVGTHVEAEVDRPRDRLRIAILGLAPLVEHPALVGPLVHADVGRVPAVRVFRGRAQGTLLTLSADPDRDPRLQRLGKVRRVLEPEVLALKIRAAPLGIEQEAQALRVLLEHVLTHADAREVEAECLGLDVVPAG